MPRMRDDCPTCRGDMNEAPTDAEPGCSFCTDTKYARACGESVPPDMSEEAGAGIAVSASGPTRALLCDAAPGKLLRVVYRGPDGDAVALPPCSHFELLHLDVDGEPLLPNMLPAEPGMRLVALERDETIRRLELQLEAHRETHGEIGQYLVDTHKPGLVDDDAVAVLDGYHVGAREVAGGGAGEPGEHTLAAALRLLKLAHARGAFRLNETMLAKAFSGDPDSWKAAQWLLERSMGFSDAAALQAEAVSANISTTAGLQAAVLELSAGMAPGPGQLPQSRTNFLTAVPGDNSVHGRLLAGASDIVGALELCPDPEHLGACVTMTHAQALAHIELLRAAAALAPRPT